MVAEHHHKAGISPCGVASSLSSLSTELSLLRRAGHLLGSYSAHWTSVLSCDEQEHSLLHQNIGLAFRTSVWAQYNKESFFPSTIPSLCWNSIWVGGQSLKQTIPSEYFQRAWIYSFEDISGCPGAFQPLHCSTHKATRNMEFNEHIGFHMSTTLRAPVSVIFIIMKILHVLSSCH